MNDKQIEAFMAVAETLNFTDAAERIFTTQPTISRYINTLEDEFGFALFYRNNKEVRLTSSGVIMYNLLSKWKSEFEEHLDIAKNMELGKDGLIKICFPEILQLDNLWSDIIPSFMLTYPNIQLEFACIDSSSVRKCIKDGTFDMAFDHASEHIDSGNLVEDPAFSTNMVLACSKKHPIAKRGYICAEDLANSTIWTIFSEEMLNKMIKDLYRHYGISSWKIHREEKFSTVLINVRMGNGILFIDPITYNISEKDYAIFELPNEYSRIDFSVFWKKTNMNPALPLLLKFLADTRMPA